MSGSALFTLSQNGTSFGKPVEHKMSVFFSTTFSKKFIFQEKFGDILLEIQQDHYIKYPLLLSDFNEN
jgi:hypothetical protein